jgi:hypothetical protein
MRGLTAAFMMCVTAGAILTAQEFSAVWKAPDVARLNFAGKKVAALVITDDQPLQMSAEEALGRELTALGVNATTTYRIVPREELKSAERAKSWYERAGVQGVVAFRPLARDTQREPSAVVWSSGYYQSFWGYWGYGWGNVYAVPVGPGRTTTTFVVETLVYDLTRDALVWAATSQTRDPKNLQDFVEDLVKATVREMRSMKFVG